MSAQQSTPQGSAHPRPSLAACPLAFVPHDSNAEPTNALLCLTHWSGVMCLLGVPAVTEHCQI